MSSLFRILLYGIYGFRRNIWLSIIAIITMTMTVTTITIFALSNVITAKKYQEFNNKIDYNIFIKEGASEEDVQMFRQQIISQAEVEHIDYIDKDLALERFNKEFGGDENLKGIVSAEDNPLPREVDVKFKDPNAIDSFHQFVTQAKYEQIVEETSYKNNRNLINNYVRLTNFLKIFGLSFTGFFILIAVLVVLNTIRLTIFSRRDEIEIMRFVGATGGYIRGPFLVEGVLFGVLGALFSAVLSWFFLYQLQLLLQQSFNATSNILTDLFGSVFSNIVTAQGFNNLFAQLFVIQLGAGVALGVICSFIAIRRYLKE